MDPCSGIFIFLHESNKGHTFNYSTKSKNTTILYKLEKNIVPRCVINKRLTFGTTWTKASTYAPNARCMGQAAPFQAQTHHGLHLNYLNRSDPRNLKRHACVQLK